MASDISDEIRQEVTSAIKAIRQKVVWKPGKDQGHLEKRRSMGHLPESETLVNYNQLIQSIALNPNHQVYLYTFGQDRYYGIVGAVLDAKWLILINPQGIMETAFPPDDLQDYLDKRGFRHLGKVSDFYETESS